MQTLTVYVGQGELTVIRHRGEAVIVDSRWPEEYCQAIARQVQAFLRNQGVSGLVLTGFDNDHADPLGVDYILENFEPVWIMYPKYTVRLKLEQYQLLTRLGVFVLQRESVKYLIHRDFFEKGDAKNLQDFSETAVDFQFLLEDGHE